MRCAVCTGAGVGMPAFFLRFIPPVHGLTAMATHAQQESVPSEERRGGGGMDAMA